MQTSLRAQGVHYNTPAVQAAYSFQDGDEFVVICRSPKNDLVIWASGDREDAVTLYNSVSADFVKTPTGQEGDRDREQAQGLPIGSLSTPLSTMAISMTEKAPKPRKDDLVAPTEPGQPGVPSEEHVRADPNRPAEDKPVVPNNGRLVRVFEDA